MVRWSMKKSHRGVFIVGVRVQQPPPDITGDPDWVSHQAGRRRMIVVLILTRPFAMTMLDAAHGCQKVTVARNASSIRAYTCWRAPLREDSCQNYHADGVSVHKFGWVLLCWHRSYYGERYATTLDVYGQLMELFCSNWMIFAPLGGSTDGTSQQLTRRRQTVGWNLCILMRAVGYSRRISI